MDYLTLLIGKMEIINQTVFISPGILWVSSVLKKPHTLKISDVMITVIISIVHIILSIMRKSKKNYLSTFVCHGQIIG